VADDKREGTEDLFEDLDKFFAPIKDVEWPEQESEPPPPPAQEEHIEVVEPEEPEVAAEVPVEPDEDDAWYDTQSMEPVNEGTVMVPDATLPGQAGLFVEDREPPEDEEPEPDDRAGVEVPSAFIPSSDIDDPTEDDVEAAAEHFAESIRVEEEEDPPADDDDRMPAPFGDEEEGDDLLADLGADEVEEDLLSDLEEQSAARTVKVGADGISGPSWQEPTSVEVGADLEHRGGRDMPAAFATGFVLALLAIASIFTKEAVFAVFATIVVLVGQFELFAAAKQANKQPATLVGLITGILVMFGAYNKGEGAVLAMVAIGVVATFLWFMAVPAAMRKDVTLNIGITVLNVAWIPMLASFLLLTLMSFGSDGKDLVAAIVVLTIVFDTIAFFAGQTFGGSGFRRPLAPDTSPKKSWEGLLVASAVVVIASLAFVSSVGPFDGTTKLNALVFGLVVSAAATFGDLAESLIKRDLKIKDMSGLLPGHGGVLDRIDSLLFAAPAAYLVLRILFT